MDKSESQYCISRCSTLSFDFLFSINLFEHKNISVETRLSRAWETRHRRQYDVNLRQLLSTNNSHKYDTINLIKRIKNKKVFLLISNTTKIKKIFELKLAKWELIINNGVRGICHMTHLKYEWQDNLSVWRRFSFLDYRLQSVYQSSFFPGFRRRRMLGC